MKNLLVDIFRRLGLSVSAFDNERYNQRKKYFGYRSIYEKYRGNTMIPFLTYIDNLEIASMASGIDGEVVECGVWRGGMIAGISEVLGSQRRYWLYDSFEGLPPAQEIDGKAAAEWQGNKESKHYYDNCRAEQQFAENAMRKAGAFNTNFVKGWFSDTVPGNSVNRIALLRLDGDWYESTKTCLEGFYDKVADGGIIIIDDYHFWEGCTRAVHDFLSERKLTDRISQGRYGVAYIVKNKVVTVFD